MMGTPSISMTRRTSKDKGRLLLRLRSPPVLGITAADRVETRGGKGLPAAGH